MSKTAFASTRLLGVFCNKVGRSKLGDRIDLDDLGVEYKREKAADGNDSSGE